MMKRPYIIFTLVLGVILGLFSMVSDSSLYQTGGLSFIDIAIQFVAGMLNDVVVWFALSIVVGYAFCRSAKQAVLAGAIFAIFAIIMYFIFSATFGAQPVVRESGAPASSFMARLPSLVEWLMAAAVGGAMGGLVGFKARSHAIVLLALTFLIILRLVLNGSFSWQSPIAVSQNITFVLIGLAPVAYIVKERWLKRTL